jgi:hypothetical protein
MNDEIPDTERLLPEHYLAVRRDGLTFLQCVKEASGCIELLAQIDRLFRTNLLGKGSPIERMVDDATGRNDADIQTFLRFVWNCIFIRVEEVKP